MDEPMMSVPARLVDTLAKWRSLKGWTLTAVEEAIDALIALLPPPEMEPTSAAMTAFRQSMREPDSYAAMMFLHAAGLLHPDAVQEVGR